MNIIHFFRPAMVPPLLALLTMMACMTLAPATSTSPPPVATQPTELEIVFTETTQPTSPAEVNQETQEAIATSAESSCTILQDLNLRSGPGTAYRPPIRTLPANSTVTPLGFAAQGIPGGRWAYVQDPTTKEKGWVSAGPQYVSCNVDLATLPSVAFGTPSTPPLPTSTQTSNPDGSGFCVDKDSKYTCVGIFSDESLFQFQVLRKGVEQGKNDGIGPVDFSITKDGNTVYSTVENNAPYCIFGDNGPCNSWVSEAGVFKWTPGGAPVEPGEYDLDVNLTAKDQNSHWHVKFNVKLP